MKRLLALVTLAIGLAAMHPTDARAQCNEACIPIVAPNGARGFGCVVDNDANAACIARSTVCYTRLCYNAMVTDPTGSALARVDICGDEVTLRPVVRERAPVRVAAHPSRAKRGASSTAKARAG